MYRQVLSHYALEGSVDTVVPYGSGHINDTYKIDCRQSDGAIKCYILQRLNHEVFKNPEELMENVMGVTTHLRKKILESGGNPDKETLTVIPTMEGKSFHKTESGDYWRLYLFIEGAQTFDQVQRPEDFYESAVAFGQFQQRLSDYPAQTLHETIPDFHNTPVRFETLKKAVEADVCGRRAQVADEIAFVMERGDTIDSLQKLQAAGALPLRVTHNDTKLNNVMLDSETGKAVCVIDLDTVMPGLAVHDFGDSIRFGASTGAEDEVDLDKISMDLELFELYTKGFLQGCGGRLTPEELKAMPEGARMMTLECGIRFLTDYLEGDTYFKVHRPGHNLDRCRTQFKLVKDMEEKRLQMDAIIRKYM